MAKRKDYSQVNDEIVGSLDILSEYRALGVVFVGTTPRSSGMIECFARGREERRPSGCINVNTGRYFDAGNGENLSLFDFAARYGGSQFKDWRDARKYYADKAGVKLGGEAGGKGKSKDEDPAESIEFLPWDAGQERLAGLWARNHKKGVAAGPAGVDALKLVGARVGRYPRWKDEKSGEWKVGKFKVIALPCYGERLLDAEPVAWVLFNISGASLEVFRGKGNPPDLVKMKSVGPTRGAMMGLHGLTRLINPGEEIPIEWVIKTGGPTDMLAVIASQLNAGGTDELSRNICDRFPVVTNASTESGDVLAHQAAVMAGQRVVVIHDCDKAGEMGNAKWAASLHGVASELKVVRLPWAVKEKHGEDVRDFLRGRPVEAKAASPQAETEAAA